MKVPVGVFNKEKALSRGLLWAFVKLRESSLPALTSTSSLPTLGGWKLQIDKVYSDSYSGSCGDIINVRTLGAGECDVHCVLWPGDGGSNELYRGWGRQLQSTVYSLPRAAFVVFRPR